jgi:hypothetical protein
MTSAHLGTVDLAICGKTVQLKYDWAALSNVITKHGVEVIAAIFTASPAQIADMVVMGAPTSGLTAEEIMKSSPPLMPIMKALDAAIGFAYWGPDGPPKKTADDKKNS